MSDFDKEAEREKLREKFERDKQKRKETQQMSELLLQGATMTNRHCDSCGDPIFRYDGREFCPSCHRGDAASDGEADAGTNVADADESGEAADRERSKSGPQPASRSDVPAMARESRPDTVSPPVPAETGPEKSSTAPPTDVTGDLEAARESLVRTITRFARAAETTDDPRRAKEHLEAAHEAAETLSALR